MNAFLNIRSRQLKRPENALKKGQVPLNKASYKKDRNRNPSKRPLKKDRNPFKKALNTKDRNPSKRPLKKDRNPLKRP